MRRNIHSGPTQLRGGLRGPTQLRGGLRLSRLGRVSAAAVLATAVVAGCTSSTTDGASVTVASGASTSATVLAGGASYASAPCPQPNLPGVPAADLGSEFTCGYLTVPENRSRPDGSTIRLGVAQLKSVSATPAADPIVYLEGGPGASPIVLANTIAPLGINADRDVIMVEQRGGYHAEPRLVCPEIEPFRPPAATRDFLDPGTREQSKAATTACRDRLAGTSVDLASYRTDENAADIADLRVAMGIDDWNVYGVSYGTDLALTVLRDHPAGIRSVVIDSVVPPNLNVVEEFWPAAAAGYKAIFDACTAQPSCQAAYPDLANEFAATVNRLATSPITVPVLDQVTGQTVEVVIDGYKFANQIILASGAGSSAAYSVVPGMIHQIANGDGTAMATQIAAQFAGSSSVPATVSRALELGVFCPEFVDQTDQDRVVARAKEELPQFPDAVLKLVPQVPWFFDDCAAWNVPTASPAARAPVVSDVPVLMLAGTFDAVTAVTFTDAAAPGLSRSQTVPLPGAGHETIKYGPCPVAVMNAFLARPEAPVDRTCVDEMALPTFATP